MGNAWRFRARAMSKWTDDNPKRMAAKYGGDCVHCEKPFPTGADIYYSRGKCWHVECWPLRVKAEPATPAAPPPPEPEKPKRPAMSTVKLDSKYGRHEYVKTDSLITWDGSTIFMSLLGAESYVQSVSGCFLDPKGRKFSYDLTVQADQGYGRHVIRRNREAETSYTKKSQKIGPALHQIVCDTRFTPEGPSIEKDYRYLLLTPDVDPAAELYTFLRREVATPTLPDWSQAIYDAMTSNARKHKTEQATAEIIEPKIGDYHALRIRAGEDRMDALITHLVSSGQISF